MVLNSSNVAELYDFPSQELLSLKLAKVPNSDDRQRMLMCFIIRVPTFWVEETIRDVQKCK
jgi:hypothetical protein